MAGQAADASPAFLDRLRQMHQELGIPEDYLDNTPLPLCVEPAELVDTEPDFYQRPQQLIPAAHAAWISMRQAAEQDGATLYLISAYRGLDYQRELIQKKLTDGRTMTDILQVIAAPGFSEHHTGRAVDIATPGSRPLTEEFEHSNAFRWLSENAARYGFSMSYPRENQFGFMYEPWHWARKD